MALAASRERVLLIVDDHDDDARLQSSTLQARGYVTHHERSAEAALEYARGRPLDGALVSALLSGRSSLELVRELRALRPGLPVVVTSSTGSIRGAVQAMRVGAADYLVKPLNPEELAYALDVVSAPGGGSRASGEIPTLERARWEHIQFVLEHCQGNISEAARLLGLHRQSLQRMLRRQRRDHAG